MAFTNILYTTNVYRCRSGNKCSNYSSLLADLVSEQKSKTEAFASREPVPHGEKSHQWSPTVIMKQKKSSDVCFLSYCNIFCCDLF